MKRILNPILAFMLAGIFLVSFTGVQLLVHHCMGCGTSEILFSGDPVSCCSSGAHDDMDVTAHAGEAMSCCVMPVNALCELGQEHHCCAFELVYLKGDFQLTQLKVAEKILLPVVAAEFLTAELPEIAPQTQHFFFDSSTDPPPRLTGRSFIIYSHQIKIASIFLCVLSA